MAINLLIVVVFTFSLILFSIVNYFVAKKELDKPRRIQVYFSLALSAICSIVPSITLWIEFQKSEYFVYSITVFMFIFFIVLFAGIVYDLASFIVNGVKFSSFMKKNKRS